MTLAPRLRAALGAALLVLLAACSKPAATTPQIEGAWVRPLVEGQSGGGGYLTVTSPAGDRLLGGSTPAAERLELHTMSMDDGVMRMREVPAIELPAGQPVKLAPGGHHLMLMGPKRALADGETVPLVLRFEKAGEVKVDAKVSAAAP